MSIESAKAFIERMKTDEDFTKKVTACKDAATRMALAKAEGYEFSSEDINNLGAELPDGALEHVAGGGCAIIVVSGEFVRFG